jgi:UPF0716 protein FxsA
MVLLPLLALFVLVPLIELYVIIQVGQAIGALPTIAILLADSILGAMLLRSQGRATWRRFNAALAAARVPAREVLDGVLVVFGGALLLTPGFVTDVLGILLLLPPTRAVVRRLFGRRIAGRLRVAGRPGGRRPPGGWDVDGTATDVDPPALR